MKIKETDNKILVFIACGKHHPVVSFELINVPESVFITRIVVIPLEIETGLEQRYVEVWQIVNHILAINSQSIEEIPPYIEALICIVGRFSLISVPKLTDKALHFNILTIKEFVIKIYGVHLHQILIEKTVKLAPLGQHYNRYRIVFNKFSDLIHYLFGKHLVSAVNYDQIVTHSRSVIHHGVQTVALIVDTDDSVQEDGSVIYASSKRIHIENDAVGKILCRLIFDIEVIPSFLMFTDGIDDRLIVDVCATVYVTLGNLFYTVYHGRVCVSVLTDDKHIVVVILTTDKAVKLHQL